VVEAPEPANGIGGATHSASAATKALVELQLTGHFPLFGPAQS
jgi:hypothetical protein